MTRTRAPYRLSRGRETPATTYPTRAAAVYAARGWLRSRRSGPRSVDVLAADGTVACTVDLETGRPRILPRKHSHRSWRLDPDDLATLDRWARRRALGSQSAALRDILAQVRAWLRAGGRGPWPPTGEP